MNDSADIFLSTIALFVFFVIVAIFWDILLLYQLHMGLFFLFGGQVLTIVKGADF